MKPRVLLLSTVHPPTDPRIVYKIAPALAQEYEVLCALPQATSTEAAITMIRLPRFHRLLFRLLFCHPVVLWKCLRLRPAVVHLFVPELIPIGFLFRWLGAEVIYEVQENLYKKFTLKRYNNEPVFQQLFRYFDHWARRYFRLVLTEHAYLEEYRRLAFPATVVHNYAALPFLDHYAAQGTASTSRCHRFFYSGVISMERGFDTLIAALALLRRQQVDFEVHLFGNVLFSWEEARALPDFDTVRPHLTFYGYTDLRLALPYAQRARAGIALLKPVGDYPDSYTTKLFEYMALELPVVTSDFPLYREVVERHQCGFCISPYNPQALADNLLWLVEHPLESEQMGQRGRRAVEQNYNWATEVQTLLTLYKTLLAPNNKVS
ncbi:glycosyltransferase family 4 protein [Rhabdobacter roseus]|uniref:Glycosyltransferase involved in cell wall biosynthesis n=1 Tax=Rhabdobacter roseus TaxID=1655419 RepID=A0A840TUB6_9BACT|nr:glycosyltransferase [Rhabdobacter roseus]MBB5284853.1 glycosyltransferase involved in cell wall biosynthesis [Rhabdobacter roseus]